MYSLSPSFTHVLAFSYLNPFFPPLSFPHSIVLPLNPPRNQVYPRTPHRSLPMSLHHVPPTLINRPHSHLGTQPIHPLNPRAILLAPLANPLANLLSLLRSRHCNHPNNLPNNPAGSLHNNLRTSLAESLRCNQHHDRPHHNLPNIMEENDN